jgi:hypothetical protein
MRRGLPTERRYSVKQADLVVGNDYAHSTSADARYAARVTILTPPRARKVNVRVVDPGSKPPWQKKASFSKGRKMQIATASIVCPWDEYAALMDSKDLAEAEARAERERREEERRAAELPDPDRLIESDYEPEYEWDPLDDDPAGAELADALNGFVPDTFWPVAPAEAVALLGDLPPMVRRDLIASLQDAPFRRPYGESQPASATARDVFGRAASVVRQVVHSRGSGRGFESPDELLRTYDAEFVAAMADIATAKGQEFTLPFVPRLPAWAADLSDQSGPVLAALGWVRVALAYTSGRKLHRLGCSVTRSGHFDKNLRNVRTMAWWEVALTPPGSQCGVCGGPAIRHGIELAHFLAAADVWEARGRDGIESWQIAVVGRLIAATTSARMREGQFDMTLSARIWDALSADAPGIEGWNAYYLANNMWFKTKDLSPAQSDSARTLAVRRLNQLLAVLPASQRLIELPSGADAETVAERYQVLSSAHKQRVLELDRALFSLEGAIVY